MSECVNECVRACVRRLRGAGRGGWCSKSSDDDDPLFFRSLVSIYVYICISTVVVVLSSLSWLVANGRSHRCRQFHRLDHGQSERCPSGILLTSPDISKTIVLLLLLLGWLVGWLVGWLAARVVPACQCFPALVGWFVLKYPWAIFRHMLSWFVVSLSWFVRSLVRLSVCSCSRHQHRHEQTPSRRVVDPPPAQPALPRTGDFFPRTNRDHSDSDSLFRRSISFVDPAIYRPSFSGRASPVHHRHCHHQQQHHPDSATPVVWI